uniref:Uncharacterized protein n=1 Tax=Oryza sativa subsp. japonica TaxID=39947 RepID=Q6Z3V2_ORYSJ|nr:hypothetical protein [Oryza sativa Japonica Group]
MASVSAVDFPSAGELANPSRPPLGDVSVTSSQGLTSSGPGLTGLHSCKRGQLRWRLAQVMAQRRRRGIMKVVATTREGDDKENSFTAGPLGARIGHHRAPPPLSQEINLLKESYPEVIDFKEDVPIVQNPIAIDWIKLAGTSASHQPLDLHWS